VGFELKRDELYLEVWTKPLTELGKKYGLSDNGLRKICRAMNIPLPVAGHWAKVAAGHDVKRPPLPAESKRTTFISNPRPTQSTHRSPEDGAWLVERERFEQKPENVINADSDPRRWHPVLVPLRDRLRQAAKEHKKDLHVAETASKRPLTRAEADSAGYGWRWFVDHGQILARHHKAAPMRVTPVTLERALLVANSVFAAAESRGFKVSLSADESRFQLEGHGGTIALRWMDRLMDSVRIERGAPGEVNRRAIKAPTGVLRIGVGSGYSEKELADTKDKPVEAQLNALFVQIYRQVVRCRERQREHNERERLWAEKQERLALEERQRQEACRRQEAEKRRREALIAESEAWRRSQAIKEYVAHVMSMAAQSAMAGDFQAQLLEWKHWSLQVAEALDPTARRLQPKENAGATPRESGLASSQNEHDQVI
jgi:hypothetical protein